MHIRAVNCRIAGLTLAHCRPDPCTPPVAVGNEYVRSFVSVKTRFGEIKLLKAVDSIKDRLSAYYHSDDLQGLQQAIDICLEQDIDFSEVEKWSDSEGHSGKYAKFLGQLDKAKSID